MRSFDHLPSDEPTTPGDPAPDPDPAKRKRDPEKDHPERPTHDDIREPPTPTHPPIGDPGDPPAQHVGRRAVAHGAPGAACRSDQCRYRYAPKRIRPPSTTPSPPPLARSSARRTPASRATPEHASCHAWRASAASASSDAVDRPFA